MNCFCGIFESIIKLNNLSKHGYLYQLLERSYFVSNYVFLGFMGKGNLASGIIALATYNICTLLLEGTLSAQISLLYLSRRRKKGTRYWLFVSILAVGLLTLVASILFLISDLWIYSLLDLSNNVIFKSVSSSWLLVGVFFFHGLQRCMQQHLLLLGKSQFRVLFPSLIGFGANIIGNLLFMLLLGLGPAGCFLSMLISKFLVVVLLFGSIKIQTSFSGWKHVKALMKSLYSILKIAYKRIRKSSLVVTNRTRRKSKGIVPSNVELELSSHVSGQQAGEDNDNEDDDEREFEEFLHEDEEKNNERKKSKKQAEEENDDINENDSSEDDGEEEENDSEVEKGHEEEEEEVEDNNPLLLSSQKRVKLKQKQKPQHSTNHLANVMRYLVLGLPGGLLLFADTGMYEVSAFLIASMGSVTLCTHQMLLILQQTIKIIFILPLAQSLACQIQFKLLHQSSDSIWSLIVWVILQCLVILCICIVPIYFAWWKLGIWFTGNVDVIDRTNTMLWYNGIFFSLSLFQTILQQIVRSVGYTWDLLGLLVLSMWLVTIIVGMYLGYYSSPVLGLEGYWIGMITGISLQILVLLYYCYTMVWKAEEMKKLHYFAMSMEDRTHGSGMLWIHTLSSTTTSSATATSYLTSDLIRPIVCSQAIGTIDFTPRTLDDEIVELEMIDLTWNQQDQQQSHHRSTSPFSTQRQKHQHRSSQQHDRKRRREHIHRDNNSQYEEDRMLLEEEEEEVS